MNTITRILIIAVVVTTIAANARRMPTVNLEKIMGTRRLQLWPMGGDMATQITLKSAEMAICVIKKKAAAAVGSRWQNFTGGIFGRRRLLHIRRNDILTEIADAAKDAAKKLALPLCESATFTIADVYMKTSSPETWVPEAQECAKEMIAVECAAKWIELVG